MEQFNIAGNTHATWMVPNLRNKHSLANTWFPSYMEHVHTKHRDGLKPSNITSFEEFSGNGYFRILKYRYCTI
jgi:hypothetical protein